MPRTEGQITSELLRKLRAACPEAVVFKFADRWTGGIPDFAVTIGERTTWWEAKRQGEKLTDLQQAVMAQLQLGRIIYYLANGNYAVAPIEDEFGPEIIDKNHIIKRMLEICKGETS